MGNETNQVVFTNQARCRDCYRCVRVCPVKAIRLKDGQAQVVKDRCVGCGTCFRECPQGAKSFRNDIMTVRELLDGDAPVVASVAPSFAGIYKPWQCRRLPSALRVLGFDHVEETAVGAWHSAKRTAEHVLANPGQHHIGSACPAVVSWVERYCPERVNDLVPVLSPMRVHASLIRRKYGEDACVVFIGPCVAKKDEADRSGGQSLVNCALTFSELEEWLQDEGIDLATIEESGFDGTPGPDARLYPVEGGSLRTSEMATDLLAQDVMAITGIDEVEEALRGEHGNSVCFLEPLFCSDGCVGGPAVPTSTPRKMRRFEVIEYARNNPGKEVETAADGLEAQFEQTPVRRRRIYSEDDIRQVLEKTGKSNPEDQLNCGACGYDSCREQAMAVLDGLAEPEMCMPYMRRLAEQRSDRIMETSPNGIVILDGQLRIVQMNPAFRQMFKCGDMVLGRYISYLVDPEPFEQLARGDEPLIETVVRHKFNNLLCQQIMYPLVEEQQYVGIFVDITRSRRNKEDLGRLKQDTINQAKELLDHQVQMAQHMTRVLGENTARGEELVARLLELASEEEPDNSSINPLSVL